MSIPITTSAYDAEEPITTRIHQPAPQESDKSYVTRQSTQFLLGIATIYLEPNPKQPLFWAIEGLENKLRGNPDKTLKQIREKSVSFLTNLLELLEERKPQSPLREPVKRALLEREHGQENSGNFAANVTSSRTTFAEKHSGKRHQETTFIDR